MSTNPYYVKPATFGLSGMKDIIAQASERKKEEAEIARKEEEKRIESEKLETSKAALSTAIANNDTASVQRLIIENPGLGAVAKQAMDLRTDPETSSMLTTANLNAALDPSKIQGVLDASEKALAIDGWTEDEKKQFSEMKELAANDPDAFRKKAEIAVRLSGDKSAISALDAMVEKGGDTKLPTTAMGQFIKQNPNARREDLIKFTQDLKAGGEYEGLESGYQTYLRANKLPNNKKNYDQYQKNQIENKKILKKDEGKWPNLADLMAQGWMPSGRITGPQMDAFESAAVRAQERGEPLTPEKLRDMEFQAVKNRSTGSAAGSRIVIARKQNIEAANGLLKDMKVVSDKLNYSNVKFIGSLEKWKKGQLNDPLFTEYMTQRTDSLFILGNALKQNGLTDKSIEIEEESFNPTLAPKAFDAWLNTQVRALNRAAEEMEKDYKYGIEPLPSYPAGQGGAPTKENPEPSLPTKGEPTVLNFDSQGNLIK